MQLADVPLPPTIPSYIIHGASRIEMHHDVVVKIYLKPSVIT